MPTSSNKNVEISRAIQLEELFACNNTLTFAVDYSLSIHVRPRVQTHAIVIIAIIIVIGNRAWFVHLAHLSLAWPHVCTHDAL